MRLSEAGELGLLHELEQRGLIVGTEHDAAELEGGLVVTQDALVEDVHFRFDLLSWRELGFRAAAVNVSDLSASAAEPEALLVTLAVPPETELDRVLELYEGIAEAGVPVRGGDTTSSARVAITVTALGHSERVPGRAGAKPGDLVVVTGPLGGAGAAFREHGSYRRRSEPPRVSASARSRPRCSTSPTGSPSTPVTSRAAPAAASRSTSTPCRWRASWTTSASARTSSCSRRRPDNSLLLGEFARIGRCEAGEGVVLLRGGEPYELPGYEHFRTS